jgi:hypothetical protein
MERLFGLGRGSFWKEEEMVKAEANKLTPEERIQMLAGEIAIRAIYDIRLLQRRKVIIGDKLAPKKKRPGLKDCCCYREEDNIKNLIDDFRNGTVLFWCRMGGVEIDQSTLNRMLKRSEYDGLPKVF